MEVALANHPRVLVVDDNADLRRLVVSTIKENLAVVATAVGSIEEAESAVANSHFDIIFFGHKPWEDGIQLYLEILNKRGAGCQFILFMDDPSELLPDFSKHFKAVRKPDFDKLIAAADWALEAEKPRRG